MNKFSKRHYELFAKEIKEKNKNIISKEELIKWLVDIFEADNDRFDFRRFTSACKNQ